MLYTGKAEALNETPREALKETPTQEVKEEGDLTLSLDELVETSCVGVAPLIR